MKIAFLALAFPLFSIAAHAHGTLKCGTGPGVARKIQWTFDSVEITNLNGRVIQFQEMLDDGTLSPGVAFASPIHIERSGERPLTPDGNVFLQTVKLTATSPNTGDEELDAFLREGLTTVVRCEISMSGDLFNIR